MPVNDLSQFQAGQPWPPPSEVGRLNRLLKNRALFDGDHARAFGLKDRLLRPELEGARKFVLNWPKRISTHWADMLFGEAPVLSDSTDEGTKEIRRMTQETGLIVQCAEAAIDVSRFGVGVLKLRLKDGRVVVEAQQPEMWYPVVSADNCREVTAHVLAWEVMVGKTRYLRLEIHTPGRIENRVHRLGTNKIGNEISLESFSPGTPKTQDTGLPGFLVVPVHNIRTTGDVYGHDDYTDLDSIILELEARLGQMSRILDKHADPNMSGPDSALTLNGVTGEWEFKGGGTFFPLGKDDSPPSYITWDGNLSAAVEMFNLLLDQLYILAESSPAAFGQLKAGLAQSGTALRRLLTADLTKTNRLRTAFDPALKEVLVTAAQLQRAFNANTTANLNEVSIDWRDGLPEDESEITTNVQLARSAGVMSRYAAVRALHTGWSEDDVNAEVARIEAEEAKALPMAIPQQNGATNA